MPSALAVLNKVIVGALYPQNGVMCCVAQFAGQGHYKLFCFCCMRQLVWIAVFCAFSSKAPLILYSSLHFSIQHYRLSCCIPADVLIIHSDEYSSNKIESKCMALIKCFSLTTIAFWTVPTIGPNSCGIVKCGFTKHRIKLMLHYLLTVWTWGCYFTWNLGFLSTKWEWWHLPYSYFKRCTWHKGGRSVCPTHTQRMLGKHALNAPEFTETESIDELRCACQP